MKYVYKEKNCNARVAIIRPDSAPFENGNPGPKENFSLFAKLARKAAEEDPDLIAFPPHFKIKRLRRPCAYAAIVVSGILPAWESALVDSEGYHLALEHMERIRKRIAYLV